MKIFGQFTVFAAVLLMAIPAKAEDAMPTSAWLVGPASLGGVDGHPPGNMPCVAATQFSNGYTIRLSGGGDKLMAMAMDVRKDQFTPREKYDVEFSIPGQYFQSISGAAYDARTLLFSLYKFPDFYTALKKAGESAATLEIKIGSNTETLNLTGLDDGFNRMEFCFNQAKPAPQQAVQQDQTPPLGMQSSNKAEPKPAAPAAAPAPTENPLIAQNAGLTPMPGDALPTQAPPAAPQRQQQAQQQQTQQAVSNLLQKAQEAEAIAAQLGSKPPEATKMASDPGNVARAWSDPSLLRPEGSDIMVKRNTGPSALVGDAAQPMRWRALRGANLRDTLEIWAKGVGVKVMWSTEDNFAVRQSLSFEGTFDQAATTLLEQFEGQSKQPVGRIYREPGSANLVLVVEQQNSAN